MCPDSPLSKRTHASTSFLFSNGVGLMVPGPGAVQGRAAVREFAISVLLDLVLSSVSSGEASGSLYPEVDG